MNPTLSTYAVSVRTSHPPPPPSNPQSHHRKDRTVNTSKTLRQRIREARENESGFTLIELLIVIIVLGILAAIVLFALGTFKSDSAAAACKTDGKQVDTAETAYYAKNNAYTSIANL